MMSRSIGPVRFWRNLFAGLLTLTALAAIALVLASAATAAASITSFTASSGNLAWPGGPVTLQATVGGSATCKFTATPAVTGLPATVGCTSGAASQSVTLPANTSLTTKIYTFKLTAAGGGGGPATSTVIVSVNPEPAPSISSFTATPVTLGHFGGPVDLAGTVADATTCKFTSTPAVTGLPATVGCTAGAASQSVTLPANTSLTTKTYTFKLTASRAGGGSVTSTAIVSLDPEPGPSIASFTATPAFLPPAGGLVDLEAGVADTNSCKFSSSPAVAGLPRTVACASGSASTSVTLPANAGATPRTYKLTLTANRAGAASAIVTRNVVVSSTSSRTDLAVSQTDAPDPVVTGSSATYALTVQNNGPDQATGVTVADTLPVGVTYVGANATQGTCSFSAGAVSCDLGVLAATAVASVDITVQTTASGTLSNTATVAGNELDPVAANNSSSEQTVVNDPITITSGPSEGATVRDNGASFQFTLSGASSATCQLDNLPSSPCTSSFSTANSKYSTNSGPLGNNLGSGSHALRISVFGSFGFSQLVRHFTVPEQPLLSSNPATGPAFAQFTNYNALSGLYPTGFSNFNATQVISEAADGSMLVLGSYNSRRFNSSSSVSDERGFVLMKVKADLTLDPSFGTGGIIKVQAPGQFSFQTPELVTAARGYIYTITYGASSDIRILRRYDLTGLKDTSFGDVTLSLPASMQAAYDYRYSSHLEVDDAGNVLVGGSMNPTNDYNNWRGMLIRVTPGGVQDAGFGDGGVVAFDAIRSPGCSGSPDANRYSVNDVVELTDGGYLVAGGDMAACYRAMATYRIDAGGAIDSSFGVGGATQATSTFGFASTMRIDIVDGGTKFMLVGGTLNSVLFARYHLDDGSADTTFNNGSHVKELWGYPMGFAPTSVSRDDVTGAYTFLGTGGAPWSPISNQNAIARATASGDADTGFDSDGILAIAPTALPSGAFVDAPSDPLHVYLGGVYANSSDILVLGHQVSGGTSNASDGQQALVRRFTVSGGTERG